MNKYNDKVNSKIYIKKGENMYTPELKQGKNKIQGLVAFFGGLVLLLYALGLLQQGLNIIIIGLSVALIVYGAMATGLDHILEGAIHTLQNFFKKH